MEKNIAALIAVLLVVPLFTGFLSFFGEATEKIQVPHDIYIGDIESIDHQLISTDVHNSDLEIYDGVGYIAFARYSGGTPSIHACKYWLSNHTLSSIHDVASYGTTDHFSVSMDIDADGYIHMVWGTHTDTETYVCSQNPEDISSWTPKESFCDSDATYQNVRCHGDTVYNLYRDGSHGQG